MSRDISTQDEDLYESIYEVIRPQSESDFEEIQLDSSEKLKKVKSAFRRGRSSRVV